VPSMRSAERSELTPTPAAADRPPRPTRSQLVLDDPAGHAPHARLAGLGLELPDVSPPKGAYVPIVRTGNLVYISGQIPMVDGELLAHGKVGGDVTTERANELSRRCALAALAAIDAAAGLENVVQVVKLTGFVASAPGYADQAAVINGASDLFVAVFGDAGRHARTSIGVSELPLGSPVEIDVIVEVRG
jgi:enamine deaminase RidA (YjgF/YER057c/UK114 family)